MEIKNAKGVAFMNHQKSGCFWYRIKHPMDALQASGVPITFVSINQDIETDNLGAFQFYGAYPFSIETILKYLKEEGKKIVYDTDDALDLIDPINPFYKSVQKDLGSANEILAFADEVTVSTPVMKEYVEKKYKGKVTVVPNCYDPLEWTFQKPKREGIRIGFVGSATHIGDLMIVLPAIKNLQKKYPDLKFFIGGFSQGDYQQWFKDYRFMATEQGINQLYSLDKMLSEIRFDWVPFVDFDNYPTMITNMALDIGIAVVADTPFNKHRSAVKSYEYNLAGALCLASNRTPYAEEPTSILVDDDKWEEQLEFYITHPDVARKVHFEHLGWIRENRDINKHIDLLKSVYIV